MIFLDGVGIGNDDPSCNPFFKNEFKTFTQIFGDTPSEKNSSLSGDKTFLFPTDANLGVNGLPQSGTGQVTIFTGVNAPTFWALSLFNYNTAS